MVLMGSRALRVDALFHPIEVHDQHFMAMLYLAGTFVTRHRSS